MAGLACVFSSHGSTRTTAMDSDKKSNITVIQSKDGDSFSPHRPHQVHISVTMT